MSTVQCLHQPKLPTHNNNKQQLSSTAASHHQQQQQLMAGMTTVADMTNVATPKELATVLRAINSFRADMNSFRADLGTLNSEVRMLSLTLRAVELRVNCLEDITYTRPESPTFSTCTHESDGGVSLHQHEANKSLVPIRQAHQRRDHSSTSSYDFPTPKAEPQRQQENEPPVRACDLKQELQPIADSIGTLTKCVVGIEKVLGKLNFGVDESPKANDVADDKTFYRSYIDSMKPFDKPRQAPASTFSTPTMEKSKHTPTSTFPPTTFDKSKQAPPSALPTSTSHTTKQTSSSIFSPSTPNTARPTQPLAENINTVPSVTATQFSQLFQGTPKGPTRKRSRSTSPSKQRRVSNSGLPEHSRPVFGQPSTPSLPMRHRQSINVDRSPFGKYDRGDERSPFSQLSTTSVRFNGGGKTPKSSPAPPMRGP